LPKSLSDGLKQLSHRQGTTPFAALLGSFQAFLGRRTGQEDILALVTIAARNQPELRNIVGLIANVIPMRLDLTGNPNFAQVLERASQVVSLALSHQMLPLGRILEMLHSSGPKSPGHLQSATASVNAPALQVLILYNNAPL